MSVSRAAPLAAASNVRRLCCLLPVACCLLPLLCGCRSNTELIENELRIKDRQLEELREVVRQKDCDVTSLEREVERLQRPMPGGPAPMLGLVESLTLGRLTGGLDEDPKCPGDEALQVLIEPRDCDKQTVKAPGSVRIDAFEINPQGLKTHLSTWELNARELRRTWDDPAFGSAAYRVVLRWTKWPVSERVRIVVRFVTPDGVNFEAERDVTIRLPERPPIKPEPVPPPQPSDPPLILPAPAEVQPAAYRTRPLKSPGER